MFRNSKSLSANGATSSNQALQPTANPLRGLSAAELGRYASTELLIAPGWLKVVFTFLLPDISLVGWLAQGFRFFFLLTGGTAFGNMFTLSARKMSG